MYLIESVCQRGERMATGRYKADIYPQLELRDAPNAGSLRMPTYEGRRGRWATVPRVGHQTGPREPRHATMTNKLTGEQLH